MRGERLRVWPGWRVSSGSGELPSLGLFLAGVLSCPGRCLSGWGVVAVGFVGALRGLCEGFAPLLVRWVGVALVVRLLCPGLYLVVIRGHYHNQGITFCDFRHRTQANFRANLDRTVFYSPTCLR